MRGRRLRAAAMAALGVSLLWAPGHAAAAARGFQASVSQRGGTITVTIAPHDGRVQWTAALNGRDITGAFGAVPPAGRRIVIGASDGVRFGRNQLTVAATYPAAQVTLARSFVVSRALPLAGAGPDEHLLGAGSVTLSAGESRAAGGGRLRYRWTIVRRPGGSRARLRGAQGQRPQLITEKTGKYELRLVVREQPLGRSRALSAARIDMVQVDQVVANSKRGIFVSTSPGGAKISGGPYAGTYALGSSGDRSLAMLFDRSTMEPLPLTHPRAYEVVGTPAGVAQLGAGLAAAQKDAAAVGDTVGMLFFDGSAGAYSDQLQQFLTKTVEVRGLPPAGGAAVPRFSFYAVPGVAGTSSLSLNASPRTQFAGLLAPDNHDNFDFAPSTVPALGEPTVGFASTPAGVTVNGSTLVSALDKPCATAGGGYQVRIVDAAQLTDVADSDNGRTFWTNSCDDNTGAVQTDRMLAFIQREALASGLGPRLVFIQGVGIPQHVHPGGNLSAALQSVSLEVRQLGGSAEAFLDNPDALTGPSYALVGKNFLTDGAVGGTESSSAEVTTAAPLPKHAPAALSGLLTRDRQWRFVVGLDSASTRLTGTDGAANLQLASAAMTIDPQTLAPTPFPNQSNPAFLKILDYTARTSVYDFNDASVADLGASLCYPMPLAPAGSPHQYLIDIRDLYCGGAKSEGSWRGAANALLGQLGTGLVAPPPGLTVKAYTTILGGLLIEGEKVDNVNTAVSDLTQPLGTQTVNASLDLNAAVKAVDTAVARARRQQRRQFEMSTSTFSTDSKLYLFGDLLDIGEIIGDFATDGAIPSILGLAGGASSIAAEFTKDQNGTPVLGPFVAGTTLSTIRAEMVSSYRSFGSALQRTRDLIVSDWGRLQVTAGLSVAKDASAQLATALDLSGSQFIWRTLMQSLFTPTRLIPTDYNPAPVDARNYRCPVWGDAPSESSQAYTMYFWRPWGKQGSFAYPFSRPHVFDDRDNLAPFEATYIGVGGQEAYVLSAGGVGYPFKSYTDENATPPYNTGNLRASIDSPPQNLPAGTFAPLFTAIGSPNQGSTNGNAATPQGIDKQLFFPQIIRAAELNRKLNTLQCKQPSQNIGGNGAYGYYDATTSLNTVPVGQP